MKKFNIIRPLLIFFCVSEVVILLVLNFVFYPALGISYQQLMDSILRIVIIQLIVVMIATIILYFIAKPLSSIENKIRSGFPLNEEDQAVLIKKERVIKQYVTLINMLGYILTPLGTTSALSLVIGYILMSSIRFLFINFLTGPVVAIIQHVYVNFLYQRLKKEAKTNEFSLPKYRFNVFKKNLFNISMAGLMFLVILVFMAQSQRMDTIGINNKAICLNDDCDPAIESSGTFTHLLNLSLESEDENVRMEAQKIIDDWEQNHTKKMIYPFVIGFVILILFMIFVAVQSMELHSHIIRIKRGLKSITALEGDLTEMVVKTDNTDFGEIQVLINHLIINLNQLFIRFYHIAGNLIKRNNAEQATMKELIGLNEQLAENTGAVVEEMSDQNQVNDETSELMKKMVELIRKNIDNAKKQSELILNTEKSFEKMNESIREVSESTEKAEQFAVKLNQASVEGSNALREMNSSIQHIVDTGTGISEIVNIIYSIADEINMLGMNAAIEAAHAGDAGTGFAIVAEEIRGLAENTSRQTAEITELLNHMSDTINTTNSKSANMSQTMHMIQQDIQSSIDIMHKINQSASNQQNLSDTNASIVKELVRANENIMKDLNFQENMGGEFNSAIEMIHHSSEKVNKAVFDQNSFLEDLSQRIKSFTEFMIFMNNELQVLDEKLSSLNLLDEDLIKQAKEVITHSKYD